MKVQRESTGGKWSLEGELKLMNPSETGSWQCSDRHLAMIL